MVRAGQRKHRIGCGIDDVADRTAKVVVRDERHGGPATRMRTQANLAKRRAAERMDRDERGDARTHEPHATTARVVFLCMQRM